MRKFSFVVAALALVLGMTQCKKENKPVANGETQHIVLTASNGNDGSKVNVAYNETTKALDLTWQKDDEIKVSGAVEGTLKLTGGENTGTATFEGTVTRKTGDQVVFTVGTKPNFENQTGDLNWFNVKENMHLVGEDTYKSDGNYTNVPMQLQYAVLKLDLSAFASDAKDGIMVTISGAEQPVSVDGITADSKAVYVAMPLSNESKTYKFKGNGIVASLGPCKLEAHTFYTGNSETGEAFVIKPKTKPADALPGLFSVSDDEQVWFSKGNLQYVKDGEKWQFATTQYETKEKSGDVVGVNYANAPVQTLFGWGDLTPLRTDAGTYSWTADWGTKIGTGWRTLSGDEWNHLIYTRKVKGETGFGKTCQWVKYNTVEGLIIYPDVYDGKLYSLDQAIALSEFPDGCVFLPAAGNRTIDIYGDPSLYDQIKNVGAIGRYWSTSQDRSNVKVLNINNGSAGISSVTPHNGFSVRLVYNY